MAGVKEIRIRLNSVKNTKKITYAMKLVSAAKLRKAQESVLNARVYNDALKKMLAELLAEMGGASFSHPLLERHSEVKKVTVVVAGGSRGLCGGYNTNVNKKVESTYREIAQRYPNAIIDAILVGKKPAEYFRRVKKSYSKSYEELPEDANLWPDEEICKQLVEAYTSGATDEVILISTRFRSALSMSVTTEQLLPLEADAKTETSESAPALVTGVTLFEPSVKEVWGGILPRIMRSQIRQAFLDAKASEQGSRMTAMDNATKNAGDLIQALQLKFNKVRQGRITAELLDIIGGAEALN